MHIAEQLQAAIPGAELAVIPKAGHVSNMEKPAAFKACVRQFCRKRMGAERDNAGGMEAK